MNTERWYLRPVFFRIVAAVLLVGLAASLVSSIFFRHNDFRNHYELGRTFLAKQPYQEADGTPFFTNYPLGRVLLNAPLALLPYRLARLTAWTAALALLFWCYRAWHAMAGREQRLGDPRILLVSILATGVLSRWILRDFDDCGLQIFLLFFLTRGLVDLLAARAARCGFWLALAASYKVTPLLYLPFLLYKRRWRESLYMAFFLLCLNVAVPALWLGWKPTLEANGLFFAKVREVRDAGRSDPLVDGIDVPTHRNRSLKASIVRYLQTYRPGHPLFIDRDFSDWDKTPSGARPHPLFLQWLDLPPRQAGRVADGILLGLAGLLAIRFRRAWKTDGSDMDPLREWATLMIGCALLSPLCWGQHLVLAMPAILLLLREMIGGGMSARRRALFWLAVALILLPQRELLGKNYWYLMQSYRLDTIAALVFIGLLLARRGAARAPGESPRA